MSDQQETAMTMPDTIYAWPSELHTLTGQWSQTRYPDEAVKFIRADIHSAEIERLTANQVIRNRRSI